MSNRVWPALPGLSPEVEREPFYKNQIFETISGKEQVMQLWATPRYRYRLTYNGVRNTVYAPSPENAYTELGVILNFQDAHYGTFDTFLYPDPYTGSNVRVRFEDDKITIRRDISTRWWTCTINLISVK